MSAVPQSINVRGALIHYLAAMWRRRWTAIVVCWLICIVGWGTVIMLPRQFESQGRFYVDVDSLLTPLLRGIAIDINPIRHLDYLRNTLLSRPNLEQVVHLAGLDATIKTPPDKEAVISGLASDVAIRPQASNLYVISYQNRDPVVAKNVVQSLLTLFAERTADNSRSEIDVAQKFLGEEIARYEAQLRAAEQRRAEFRQRYIDVLPGAGSNVPRLDAMRQAARQSEEQYQDAIARRDTLKSQLAAVPQFLSVDSSPSIMITDGRGTPTERRLNKAKENLDELRLHFTDQHPDVIATRRQIAELEAEVQDERAGGSGSGSANGLGRKTQVTNPVFEQLKVRLADAESAVAATKRRLDDTRHELAAVEKTALIAPEIEAKAQDLDRDYDVIKRNYEELLSRREATTLAQSADIRADKITFRVVDPPEVPIKPAAPNRPLLFSVVLILGLSGGGGLALLLTQVDRSFGSASQLRELGLPVLGAVAYVSSFGRRPTYVAQVAGFAATTFALFAVFGVLVILSTGLYRMVI